MKLEELIKAAQGDHLSGLIAMECWCVSLERLVVEIARGKYPEGKRDAAIALLIDQKALFLDAPGTADDFDCWVEETKEFGQKFIAALSI